MIRMIIRRLLLAEYCRKTRKLVFAMFIWRLSSIFYLGLCVLIGQSELSTLPSVPGLLIDSPGNEVGISQALGNPIQVNKRPSFPSLSDHHGKLQSRRACNSGLPKCREPASHKILRYHFQQKDDFHKTF